jgi:hypothetical protein
MSRQVRWKGRTHGQAGLRGRQDTWEARNIDGQDPWASRTHAKQDTWASSTYCTYRQAGHKGMQGTCSDRTRHVGHMDRQDIWTGRRLRQKGLMAM